MTKLTHLDESGAARMVDIGAKDITARVAVASAEVSMRSSTMDLLVAGGHKKGDVLAVARVAAIQAAKKCSDLIPLCHPLMLNSVTVDFNLDQERSVVEIETRCRVSGKTGVEMEALTAASVAALTIYDMCKAVDRGMQIDNLAVQEKSGGKSGDWTRDGGSGG